MYDLLDTTAAIKEVQKFLFVISDSENQNIPRVAVDGIYGVETANAVTVFQQDYGLAESGIVDKPTFDKLYLVYTNAIAKNNTKDYIITKEGFPFKVGSQGNDIVALHLYITELGKTYENLENVGKGSYYNEQTRQAVINLQKIFNIAPTGEIDAFFFERMLTELDAIRRLEEIYE